MHTSFFFTLINNFTIKDNINDKYSNFIKYHLLDCSIRKYKEELTLN